jgi:hypothetical protein
MEQAVEEMKKMQFSPRFIRGCERSLCESLAHLHLPVNARVVFDRKRCMIEKTKSYLYVCHSPSPFKKKGTTELIYANEFLSIYRQSRDDKSAFIIESDKKNFAWFNYDYKSSPLIIESKINVEGQDFNILFLSFLNEKETISIISTDRPTFFTGLPFAITSASKDEAVLGCGRKATFSLERLERVSSSLTFFF